MKFTRKNPCLLFLRCPPSFIPCIALYECHSFGPYGPETLGLYFVLGLYILPACTVQNYCPRFWGCTSVLSHSVEVCLGLRRAWVTREINVSLRKDQSFIHTIYLMTAWPVRICTFEGSVKVQMCVPVTLIVQSLPPWCVTLGWDLDGSCAACAGVSTPMIEV